MSQARNLVDFGSIVSGLTGEVKMWPVATPPAGYLICNGQAVSRTTYANLFVVLTATFGNGDGSTTFNLPNYTDSMPVGAGNLYNVAGTGGSKDAVLVSHSHGVNDPGHGHSTDTQTASGNFYAANRSGPGPAGVFYDAGGRSSSSLSGGGLSGDIWQVGINYAHSHGVSGSYTGISLNSAGSSGTNANMPPYVGIYFIIKY